LAEVDLLVRQSEIKQLFNMAYLFLCVACIFQTCTAKQKDRGQHVLCG